MTPYKTFTAEQLRNVIEGKCSYERIPMLYNFWSYPDIFGERKAEAEELMRIYPYDMEVIHARMPEPAEAPEDDPDYKWIYLDRQKNDAAGLDAQILIEDWETELDDIIAHFPNPDYPGLFPETPAPTDKYRVVHWWNCLFERIWSLRGMENALTDFYLYPDELHTIFQKFIDFYLRVIERAHDEMHADAIILSDDIGTQNSPFFSEEIFLEFFKPYYKQLIDKAHSLGMHFWLHTCGNVQLFIPHLIEIGLDVLHPIQKYTMDEREIAAQFGDKICIWAGFDVQQTIPYGTPEEVRKEVRFMIDTYARKDGRLMMTCGNGLTPDCPFESFRALLDETYHYGTQKMTELHSAE